MLLNQENDILTVDDPRRAIQIPTDATVLIEHGKSQDKV